MIDRADRLLLNSLGQLTMLTQGLTISTRDGVVLLEHDRIQAPGVPPSRPGLSFRHWRPTRCRFCKGDGSVAVHRPAPEGKQVSALLGAFFRSASGSRDGPLVSPCCPSEGHPFLVQPAVGDGGAGRRIGCGQATQSAVCHSVAFLGSVPSGPEHSVSSPGSGLSFVEPRP